MNGFRLISPARRSALAKACALAMRFAILLASVALTTTGLAQGQSQTPSAAVTQATDKNKLAPDQAPRDFQATFTLSARNLEIGKTRWALTSSGNNRFTFSADSEALGLAKVFRDERISEISEWRIVKNRVQPLRYTYSRKGGKRDRDVQIDFDWDKATARNALNGKSWSMPLADGTLDKLVYVIALMKDLAGGQRTLSYAVADGGKTKTYSIKTIGEEQVDTVIGALRTVVVERRQKGKSRITRIWCASALDFLPVKIEHIEDDGTLYFELASLEGLSVQ